MISLTAFFPCDENTTKSLFKRGLSTNVVATSYQEKTLKSDEKGWDSVK